MAKDTEQLELRIPGMSLTAKGVEAVRAARFPLNVAAGAVGAALIALAISGSMLAPVAGQYMRSAFTPLANLLK
jgi:hypothetical protein